MNDVADLLDPNAVHDRESFFAFVAALAAERQSSAAAEDSKHNPYSPARYGWENVTIENFLEAALAWARSTEMGVKQGLASEPSWREFAVFLNCGKIYE